MAGDCPASPGSVLPDEREKDAASASFALLRLVAYPASKRVESPPITGDERQIVAASREAFRIRGANSA